MGATQATEWTRAAFQFLAFGQAIVETGESGWL